jgi:hypothetical protein
MIVSMRCTTRHLQLTTARDIDFDTSLRAVLTAGLHLRCHPCLVEIQKQALQPLLVAWGLHFHSRLRTRFLLPMHRKAFSHCLLVGVYICTLEASRLDNFVIVLLLQLPIVQHWDVHACFSLNHQTLLHVTLQYPTSTCLK